MRKNSGMFSTRTQRSSLSPLPLMLIAFLIGLGLLEQATVDALFFPDLALHGMHRSGRGSRFVIAALKEEPYLYGNETGYVADLMRALTARYYRYKNGTTALDYEVVPVTTWDDLLNRANSEHVQIAFGLICPYLLRTDAKFSGMHSSAPVVHTSVKFITGTPTTHSQSSNRQAPPLWDLPNLVNVKGSPEDRLIESRKRGGQRRGSQQQVVRHNDMDTLDSALDHIRHHSNDFLVTDASVADCVVSHENVRGLQAVCPSRRLSHSGHLYYGFFGKNSVLLKVLNDLLKLLLRDGELDELRVKYFRAVRHCD